MFLCLARPRPCLYVLVLMILKETVSDDDAWKVYDSNLSGRVEQGLQVAEIRPRMPQLLLDMPHMVVSKSALWALCSVQGERPGMCRSPARSGGRPPWRGPHALPCCLACRPGGSPPSGA